MKSLLNEFEQFGEIEFAIPKSCFRSHSLNKPNWVVGGVNDNEIFYDSKHVLTTNINEFVKGDNEVSLSVMKEPLHDFVIRFVIDKSKVESIKLGDELLEHRSSNIYRETLVGKPISITLKSRQALVINAAMTNKNESALLYQYVRDEPGGKWIVHIRLRPLVAESYLHPRLVCRLYTGNLIPWTKLSDLLGKYMSRLFPSLIDKVERTGRGNFQITPFGMNDQNFRFTVHLSLEG